MKETKKTSRWSHNINSNFAFKWQDYDKFKSWRSAFWLVFVIISNIDIKTCQNQNWLDNLLLISIPIVHKQVEDSNNEDRDLKGKIYHLALETKLKRW